MMFTMGPLSTEHNKNVGWFSSDYCAHNETPTEPRSMYHH